MKAATFTVVLSCLALYGIAATEATATNGSGTCENTTTPATYLNTFSDIDILLQDTNSTDYGPSGEKCCIRTMSICMPLLCTKRFSKGDDFSCLSECVGVICKYYKDNGYDDGCIKPYRDSCKKKKKPVKECE